MEDFIFRPIISMQGWSGGFFCVFCAVKIADKIKLFKREIVKSYCLEHIVFSFYIRIITRLNFFVSHFQAPFEKFIIFFLISGFLDVMK